MERSCQNAIYFFNMYFFSQEVEVYFILILPNRFQRKQTIVQIDTDGEAYTFSN